MIEYKSNSEKTTKEIGFYLGQTLLKNKKNFEIAFVLALKGNLGSGKTTFLKGFKKALKIKKEINSPTFIILKKYPLKLKKFENFYHLDCYRIKNLKELKILKIEEILKNNKNIIAIEWPEKIKKILPKNSTIFLTFLYGKKENERIIKIKEK